MEYKRSYLQILQRQLRQLGMYHNNVTELKSDFLPIEIYYFYWASFRRCNSLLSTYIKNIWKGLQGEEIPL